MTGIVHSQGWSMRKSCISFKVKCYFSTLKSLFFIERVTIVKAALTRQYNYLPAKVQMNKINTFPNTLTGKLISNKASPLLSSHRLVKLLIPE